MPKYKIYAGLGGGFGGSHFIKMKEHKNEDSALQEAWEYACEKYESYSGLHGIRSIEEIQEEENCDEDEALDIYCDERESWISYHVEKVFEICDSNGDAEFH